MYYKKSHYYYYYSSYSSFTADDEQHPFCLPLVGCHCRFFLNENFDFSLQYIHIRHNPLPTTTDNVKLIRNNYPYLSLKQQKKVFHWQDFTFMFAYVSFRRKLKYSSGKITSQQISKRHFIMLFARTLEIMSVKVILK